jgi:hypothetical protein
MVHQIRSQILQHAAAIRRHDPVDIKFVVNTQSVAMSGRFYTVLLPFEQCFPVRNALLLLVIFC